MQKYFTCFLINIKLSWLLIFIFCLITQFCYGQKSFINVHKYKIHHQQNKIENAQTLLPFFKQLHKLEKTKTGKITILHIGDSHLQAGFFTEVPRKTLQQIFGNAGRGVMFPYPLAKSNSPADYNFSSVNNWQFNRVAHPEIPLAPGVSGFCIQTTDTVANIFFQSNDAEILNNLTIFTDTISQWSLNQTKDIYKKNVHENFAVQQFDSLNITSANFNCVSDSIKNVYGFYNENYQSGIIYSTIGVNGARYDHYNKATLFWEQLKNISTPSLIIVSLGTNEAQIDKLQADTVIKNLDVFFNIIKQNFPQSCLLITTPAESFKDNHPNIQIRMMHDILIKYCQQHHIAYWDLYKITNGYRSCYYWKKCGLMSKDKIHFTKEGYWLHGQLFTEALLKAYREGK